MILRIEWFGTTASLRFPDEVTFPAIPRRPQLGVEDADGARADLEVEVVRAGEGFDVHSDGDLLVAAVSAEQAWGAAWGELELQVAARSVDPVFVHAGAVAIDGRGYLFPGRSGVGKTTLVLHLVRELGAVYYSDEYALLDRDAYLHPYARDPHVRSTPGARGTPTPLASVTSLVGSEPVPVAGVVLAERIEGAGWAPKPMKPADCALALLDNAVGARVRTPAVLDAVGAVADLAWCVKSRRDRLSEVSDWLQTRVQMS